MKIKIHNPIIFAMVFIAEILISTSSVDAKAAQLVSTFTVNQADIDDATALVVKLLMTKSSVIISPPEEQVTYLIEATIEYEDDKPSPQMSTNIASGEFNIEFDGEEQNWEIKIAPGLLNVDIDAISGSNTVEADLGGLHIRDASFNNTAYALTLDFSTPTTRQVETLNLTGSATAITALNLGNSDFRNLFLRTSAGSAALDFNGAYQTNQHNFIALSSIGSVTFVLPDRVGEKILSLSGASSSLYLQFWEWFFSPFWFLSQAKTVDYNDWPTKIDGFILLSGSSFTVSR